MPCFTRRIAFPLLVTLTAVLAGCASPEPAYERENFAQSDTFSRTVPAANAAACAAGRRALLSQGYNIDKFEASRVTGHKNFQNEDGEHTQISFNIECASDGSADERATVFANAVQDRYSVKRTSNSASVGVSVLGQVSMPFGASDDSLVKTGSQTVTRPKFYDGFFQLLQRFLPDAQAAATPSEPPSARGKAAGAKTPTPPDPVVPSQAPADTLNPATANGAVDDGGKAGPAASTTTTGNGLAPAATPAATGSSPAPDASPPETGNSLAPAATPAATGSCPAPDASPPTTDGPPPGAVQVPAHPPATQTAPSSPQPSN